MTVAIPAGFRVLPLPVIQLSLAAVLKCGQSFRWSIFPLHGGVTPQHEYRLCLRDRVVCLRQTQDALFYRSAFPHSPSSIIEEDQRETETLSWIRDYFQLDIDLQDLYRQWAKRDPVFEKLQDRFEGIRILRQDPFECLLSFICSSNNNIARITKMVKALCTQFSTPLLTLPRPNHDGSLEDAEVDEYHPFPPPAVLASSEVAAKLRSLGFGYRADFIQRTARMLVDLHGTSTGGVMEPSEKWLFALRDMSTVQAREELLKFVGVGRKVADCILLMSLDKREVVPVDTHVHQIAVKHYGMPGSTKTKANMTPKLYDQLNTKLTSIWGEYAGWAHSVLFTSDLKAFSSYGLSSPSSMDLPPLNVDMEALSPGPASATSPNPKTTTPSRPPTKRKRPQTIEILVSLEATADISVSNDGLSLAERVKARSRVKRPKLGLP